MSKNKYQCNAEQNLVNVAKDEDTFMEPRKFCDFGSDSNVWVFRGSTHYVCVGTHDDDSSFHSRMATGMLRHLLEHLNNFESVPDSAIIELTKLAKKESAA